MVPKDCGHYSNKGMLCPHEKTFEQVFIPALCQSETERYNAGSNCLLVLMDWDETGRFPMDGLCHFPITFYGHTDSIFQMNLQFSSTCYITKPRFWI